MNSEVNVRINQKLIRELGQTILTAIYDTQVVEIMLNSDGQLWIESLDRGMEHKGKLAPETAEALLSTIATSLNTTITRQNPILEGELLIDGSRFEGLIPPVVKNPVFCIRKRASKLYTLDEYVKTGVISFSQKMVIQKAVANRKNILVVGGTGTGKTTFTNAIIDQMVKLTPHHRLVIIEDTSEIQCAAKNAVTLRTSDDVDMKRLLRATMRLSPDRILVGEVRGGEALSLLKAWNTGHPGGVATIHANSAAAGLVRLEQLISEVSHKPMESLIAEAVDLVISMEKTTAGRKVKEIIQVTGFDPSGYGITNL
ncbi:MAG: P-type conjugative transfer ATPase TrbB [Candidatus Margulisbacteria bacterium]|nr:P-type conjugative transfer ATPase TrbB [Candidatus Margulisiibacteriota bacterium]